ncbi:hypothetical protein RB195_004727 [Necator americanus]|uniref:CARMIL C-terminal domain-containing protein n=1 Tax=Necator americanus TaxID=51031 RepID=A0ABR1BJC4_NECAM
MARPRVSWRSTTAIPEDSDVVNEPLQQQGEVKSAGCSPMFQRRRKLLGCAGPSLDSSYQLNEIVEVGELVAEMSPRARRSRLRKIFASLTPTKKPKSLSSFDLDRRIDENDILTVCEEVEKEEKTTPVETEMPGGRDARVTNADNDIPKSLSLWESYGINRRAPLN